VKLYYVYIVNCSDGTYYTGITSTLEARLAQHNLGVYRTCYTFSRRPVALAWCAEHHEVWDAIGTEKKIKGWSHDKKTALINGDFKALKELSHSRISASHPSTSSG